LIEFIKISLVLSFNACSLGHMWSTLFERENQTILTAFCMFVAILAGSGIVSKSDSNPLVSILCNLSPQRYTVELYIHRLLSKNPASMLVLA